MARFQKPSNPTIAGTSPLITPIEPTTDGELSNLESDNLIDEPTTDDESRFSESTSQALLNTVKARNTRALDELQKQMDHLRDDFVNQAVSIVENGFKDCFFRASQRIHHLQLDWTTTDGNELGETINTISLPGTITDGDTE